MRNRYWTIQYSNGWFDNCCRYLRRDAITAYLNAYSNSPLYRHKTWAWHKRNKGVRVVRVVITEA
jgi:hypothetical protein